MKVADSAYPPGQTIIKPISRPRQERIYKVHEMFEGGAKIKEIAQFFGISERMVFYDLKDAKMLLQKLVDNFIQGETLGGEIAFWHQIIRQAMRDYSLSSAENAKIGFLRVASEARAKLQKLYQDTGLITVVPIKFKMEGGNPFTEDPELRTDYLALMVKAQTKGIKIPGL
jgi:hypothetical protein